MLERDEELAALSAAVAAAAAGHGALVLVEGPAGIGKTTLLRAACQGDLRILTARGLALEQGFPYGIVRQLLDPVRREEELLDGAAGLAVRVFDWTEAGPVEDDVRYATMHGLYWLVANLAARQPLVLAVDDAHWADAPSLRWLAHLAARIEALPVALLLAVREGPDEPPLLDELRAAATRLRPGPLGPDATAALVRRKVQADAELCRECHASTGGNPFLVQALATALRDGDQKVEPIAQAVLRRIGAEEARRLARALAVLGGPAPLRQAAALAGLDLPAAARLADRLRAADVLAPGAVLEFAHPILRTAVYESIPPGERALAHAEAAALLERDGADAERLALHLLHSEPGGDPRVAARLRAAAAAASGRGAPGAATDYLRRALDEPPDPGDRPAILLELGVALARERSPAAVPALRESVRLEGPEAALPAARMLGIWGYHADAAAICRDALSGPVPYDLADSLEAELFQSSLIDTATAGQALARAGSRLSGPSGAWRASDALVAAVAGQRVLDRLAPVPAGDDIPPDSLTAVYALLALIWTDELGTAERICDTALTDARRRGSMSMVAHASCLHSMIMRRLGRLEEAAADARLALDFKLATSPPMAVAWAAAFCVDALTCLGRLEEAEAVAEVTAVRRRLAPHAAVPAGPRRAAGRDAPPGRRARGPALGRGGLGGVVENPAVASWRTAAVAAHHALFPRRAVARRRDGSPRERKSRQSARTWPKPSACSKPRPPATSWPSPWPTTVPACAGPGSGRGPASRCAAPSTWPSGPARPPGRRRAAGPDRGRGPAPARRPHRPGRADRGRTAGRRPGRRRREQPADRRAPVHHPGHGGNPPAARLPQARHHLPGRPDRRAQHIGSTPGLACRSRCSPGS